MSNFDIGAFMSSLGTPDVGATTDPDYSFDVTDYMGDYDPLEDDLAAYMGGSKFDDKGFNLDFLDALGTGDLSDYSGNFDDQGFNIDFLDNIFGTSGGFSDDIFSNTSSLEALLAAAQGDSKEDKPNAFQNLANAFFPQSKGSGGSNILEALIGLGGASFLKDRGYLSPNIPDNTYQGSIPDYTAVREQVTGRDDTGRRPGSGGRRYFSDTIYAKKPEGQEPMSVEEARAAAKAQAAGFMGGGSVLQGGGYLQGDSDGQADLIPADIDGVQEARLSHGEFVLPADVVAMLGNGNSDAGAEALDEFMSTVRTKATGTPKQQKNIDADKVLMMLSKGVS